MFNYAISFNREFLTTVKIFGITVCVCEILNLYSDCTCIYSTQFANLRNFKIVPRTLEIAKLQTNFEIAQPSLRNLRWRCQVYEILKSH